MRQATLEGFEAKGIKQEEGEALLRKSVEIALEARDTYYAGLDDGVDSRTQKHPILVAASVGSYGAYLADGSEYRLNFHLLYLHAFLNNMLTFDCYNFPLFVLYSGIYGENVTLQTLKDFHRRRVQVLDDSGADLIAFETIPNKLEAQVAVYSNFSIKVDVRCSFSPCRSICFLATCVLFTTSSCIGSQLFFLEIAILFIVEHTCGTET